MLSKYDSYCSQFLNLLLVVCLCSPIIIPPNLIKFVVYSLDNCFLISCKFVLLTNIPLYHVVILKKPASLLVIFTSVPPFLLSVISLFFFFSSFLFYFFLFLFFLQIGLCFFQSFFNLIAFVFLLLNKVRIVSLFS